MRWLVYFTTLLLPLLPKTAFCQNSFETCNNNPTVENCSKLVTLPAYCLNSESSRMFIGLNLANGNYLFTLETDLPKFIKKGSFFAADGRIRDSKLKEIRLTSSTCKSNDSVTTCEGEISASKADLLSGRFNFDQQVINFLLRDSNQKDLCIGKLANDESLLTSKGRTVRQFCSFTPNLSHPELSGVGFFDPSGYGLEGESHLHFLLEGFPEGKNIVGCSPVGNRYQEVLSFRSYSADSEDSTIYNQEALVDNSLLQNKPLEYSYDLVRSILQDSGQIQSYSRNLALINRQVSKTSASNEVRESNNKFKELKREQKKKKQQNQNSSSRAISRLRNLVVRNQLEPESLENWLSFDPIAGGDIVLSTKCSNSSVSNSSYGVISCGPLTDQASCIKLSSQNGDSKGNFCIEERLGSKIATIRIEDLELGSYYLCNNETLVSSFTIEVKQDEFGSFGELLLTDSLAINSKLPAYKLEVLSGLDKPSISTKSDCSQKIMNPPSS